MNEIEAIKFFIKRVVSGKKSQRYCSIIETKKGKYKFLSELSHGFQNSLKTDLQSIQSDKGLWSKPCYIYSSNNGFGIFIETFLQAYDLLSSDDGWIIVSQDAKYGFYRPEADWDNEIRVLIQ